MSEAEKRKIHELEYKAKIASATSHVFAHIAGSLITRLPVVKIKKRG